MPDRGPIPRGGKIIAGKGGYGQGKTLSSRPTVCFGVRYVYLNASPFTKTRGVSILHHTFPQKEANLWIQQGVSSGSPAYFWQ